MTTKKDISMYNMEDKYYAFCYIAWPLYPLLLILAPAGRYRLVWITRNNEKNTHAVLVSLFYYNMLLIGRFDRQIKKINFGAVNPFTLFIHVYRLTCSISTHKRTLTWKLYALSSLESVHQACLWKVEGNPDDQQQTEK